MGWFADGRVTDAPMHKPSCAEHDECRLPGPWIYCVLKHGEDAIIARLRHVEPQMAGRALGQAESISRRQNDIVGKGRARHIGGIEAIREFAPQEHAGLGFNPGFDAQHA